MTCSVFCPQFGRFASPLPLSLTFPRLLIPTGIAFLEAF